MSLPLLTVVLSLGLQAAASAIAFRLAMSTRRVAFLLLSIATFLMAVRRGFSLHELLLSHRPLDTGAEAIALAISALILVGLLGLRQPSPGAATGGGAHSASRGLRQLEATALVLGALAVVGGGTAGYRAYRASRESSLEAEARSCAALARAIRFRADARVGEHLPLPEAVAAAARVLFQEVLQGYGYRVLVASDGEEALDILGKHAGPIHLLLTDVVMPGMSGSALWERSRIAHPEMKVLFMSGYTDEVVGRHGALDPGVDLLEKPFQPEALGRRIRQVLDRAAPR